MPEADPTRLLQAAARLAAVTFATALAVRAQTQQPAAHRHAQQHPTDSTPGRFTTSRSSPIVLPLPGEEDAFLFAVFGDRTGGPAEGIEVLREAVDEVNLFEPDLVMTVGDLIEGYNEEPEWLAQAAEFKGVMDGLLCPWFPVAGNHDVYWRGPGEKPAAEHEGNYELHFGPLWYAFEHKGVWFVVLYTDEGDPETGVRTFREPASQRMSPEQLAWLEEVLARASDAHSVLVFLHHPRWIGGGYGDDWERVHRVLANAGNVRAVFAGHIHHMRYDGPRDGIEYFTLATVGGHQSGAVPAAGYLHQYHLVTVREQQLAIAALPVGSAFDPRDITSEVAFETRKVATEMVPEFDERPRLTAELGAEGNLMVTLTNPGPDPVDVTLRPTSEDSRWAFTPDHMHFQVPGGGVTASTIGAWRPQGTVDDAFRLPYLAVDREWLGTTLRIPLPEVRVPIPLDLTRLREPEAKTDRALAFQSPGARAEVPAERLALGDGPLTVETWVLMDELRVNAALVDRSEGGGFGLYANDGKPRFAVRVADDWAVAEAETAFALGEWQHVAGVFDGDHVRLFVDGALVASAETPGPRSPGTADLWIGDGVRSDVSGAWKLAGFLDEVRITRAAVYAEAFTPAARLTPADDTGLLLRCDSTLGPWLVDASGSGAHARLAGDASLVARE